MKINCITAIYLELEIEEKASYYNVFELLRKENKDDKLIEIQNIVFQPEMLIQNEDIKHLLIYFGNAKAEAEKSGYKNKMRKHKEFIDELILTIQDQL